MEVSDLSPDARHQVVSSPFVSSWVHKARPEERYSADLSARAAGWARWALASLVMVRSSRRDYMALQLDGRLFRSGRLHERAHLEIPARTLTTADPLFPERLALVGSGAMFPSLIFDEIASLRRSIFAPGTTSASIVELLSGAREHLVSSLVAASAALPPDLSSLALVDRPQLVSDLIRTPFTHEELAGILPPVSSRARQRSALVPGRSAAQAFSGFSAACEPGLVAAAGANLSRRLHMWHITAADGTAVAVTPRLTVGSLLRDPLFAPQSEGAAAALMRLAVLSRVMPVFGLSLSQLLPPPPPEPGFLRAVPARANMRTPEASLEGAVLFCRNFSDPQQAYAQLLEAAAPGVLAVSFKDFKEAHEALTMSLHRAEEPGRTMVDKALPLVVHADGGIVRLTFSRLPG